MAGLNIGITNPNPSLMGRYLHTLLSYNDSYVPELQLGQSGRVELEGWDRVNSWMPVSDVSNGGLLHAMYLIGGVSLADGDLSDLQLDSTGALRTNPGELSYATDSVTNLPAGAANSPATRGLVNSTSGGTVMAAARAARNLLIISNVGSVEIDLDTDGGNPVYGSTTTYPLPAGQTIRLTTTKGVKGITAAATSASFAMIEEYSP